MPSLGQQRLWGPRCVHAGPCAGGVHSPVEEGALGLCGGTGGDRVAQKHLVHLRPVVPLAALAVCALLLHGVLVVLATAQGYVERVWRQEVCWARWAG